MVTSPWGTTSKSRSSSGAGKGAHIPISSRKVPFLRFKPAKGGERKQKALSLCAQPEPAHHSRMRRGSALCHCHHTHVRSPPNQVTHLQPHSPHTSDATIPDLEGTNPPAYQSRCAARRRCTRRWDDVHGFPYPCIAGPDGPARPSLWRDAQLLPRPSLTGMWHARFWHLPARPYAPATIAPPACLSGNLPRLMGLGRTQEPMRGKGHNSWRLACKMGDTALEQQVFWNKISHFFHHTRSLAPVHA